MMGAANGAAAARRGAGPLLALAVVLVVAFAAYAPGLSGPFIFDDVLVIERSPALAMTELTPESLRDAAMSAGRSYPQRGLARVSFALNHYFAGGRVDVRAYKLTNLFIHLLNGVLVYALAAALLARIPHPTSSRSNASGRDRGLRGPEDAIGPYLPVAVAALWVLHPIQLTAVLYVVQRMTSLAAMFVLAGLLVFVAGRARVERGRRFGIVLMALGLGGGTALGLLAKENAVLAPLFAGLVELFFFRRDAVDARARRALLAFYMLAVALPVVAGAAWYLWNLEYFAEAYRWRDFSLVERLLTEARIVAFYVALLLAPYSRWFGIYHDDIATSRGWLEPWTTLPSVLLWVALVALALFAVRRRSPWAFGVLWFCVGHALESTVIGLELVFEHRNYVPSFGPLLAAAYYGSRALAALPRLARLQVPITAALALTLGAVTFSRSAVWDSIDSIIELGLRNHPRSSRYHAEKALALFRADAPAATVYPHLQRAFALDRTQVVTGGLMALTLLERRAHAALPGAPAGGDPPHPLGSPELPPAEHFETYWAALMAEMDLRMRALPMKTSSVELAAIVYRCTVAGAAPCAALLPTVIEWFTAAVDDNPHVQRTVRATMTLQLGKLHALAGDVDRAIALAERAARMEPGAPDFHISRAVLYLELGDADAAARAIADVRATLPLGYRGAELAQLEAALARVRAAQPRAGAESRGR